MTAFEAIRKVRETGTAHLLRPRKDEPGRYDMRPYGAGNKRGWVILDITTAGAVLTVHGRLSRMNQDRLEKMPLGRLVEVCWKLVR